MSATWPLFLAHAPGKVTSHVQRVAEMPLHWSFDDHRYVVTDDDIEGLVKLATSNLVEGHIIDRCPGQCLFEGFVRIEAGCECLGDDDLKKGRTWLSQERRRR